MLRILLYTFTYLVDVLLACVFGTPGLGWEEEMALLGLGTEGAGAFL